MNMGCFPLILIFFNTFQQCFVVFKVKFCTSFVKFISKYLIVFDVMILGTPLCGIGDCSPERARP